jgi:type III secretion protein J
VFIRHHANMPMANLVPQIKMLVANGVAGLAYDKVSVILVPVEAHEAAAANEQRADAPQMFGRDALSLAGWPLYGLVAVIAMCVGAFGVALWRQRQQVYPLRAAEPVKSP